MIGLLLFFVVGPMIGYAAFRIGYDEGYDEGYDDCRAHYAATMWR